MHGKGCASHLTIAATTATPGVSCCKRWVVRTTSSASNGQVPGMAALLDDGLDEMKQSASGDLALVTFRLVEVLRTAPRWSEITNARTLL